MKIRCPCNRCLVKVTCNQSCDKFTEFIEPIYKMQKFMSRQFEKIDCSFGHSHVFDKCFTLFGEYLFLPFYFVLIISITGMEIRWTETNLMDVRIADFETKRKKLI